METDGRTDELAGECVEQLRAILAMSPCEWYLPARRALAAYDDATRHANGDQGRRA